MTDIVREAEELLAGVTPGEWKSNNSNGIHVGCRCVATTEMEPREQRVKDAAFIANAPRLIRSLLQRLRETEESRQGISATAVRIVEEKAAFRKQAMEDFYSAERELRVLRAENAKLRAAVKGETFYHSDEAANEEMNRLRAERDELKEALEAVKWSGGHGQCPYCGADPGPRGHEASCRLDKALTRAGEE